MGAKHVIGIVGIVVIFVLVGVVYDLHGRTESGGATAQQPPAQPAPRETAGLGVVQGTVPNPPPIPVIPADDPIDNAMARSAVTAQNTATPQAATEPISASSNASRISPPANDNAQPPSRPRIYVVQKGDSLYSISRKVYGDTSKWRVIYEANRHIIKNKNVINAGWKLTIPGEGGASSAAAASTPVTPVTPVASAAGQRIEEIAPEFKYTVKPGNTLESSAENIMNNRDYANMILRLNRDRIRDPKNLPPGLILEVPKMGKGN